MADAVTVDQCATLWHKKAAMQKVWIPGRTPGMNALVKAVGRTKLTKGTNRVSAYSELKKTWSRDVAVRCLGAKLAPVESAYFTFVSFRENTRTDPDNFCGVVQKIALDGMQSARIIENDGWRQVLGIAHYWATGKVPGFWIIFGSEVLQREQALEMVGWQKTTN